jgi:DOPA 4,5-dioxygenase
VYFTADTKPDALAIREEIGAQFRVELGRVHDVPVGPHPTAMYQVAFGTPVFANLVPWLMLNRRGLSILVHPETGDDVGDHADRPLWLGRPQVLDIEFLRAIASS